MPTNDPESYLPKALRRHYRAKSGSSGSSRMNNLTRDLDRRRRTGEERAGRLETQVDERREGFDARDYAREVASASYADFAEDYDEGISNIRGSAVGMGRLRSGFSDEDESEFTQDLNSRLARELARGAFTAGSLDLRNTEGMSGEAIESRRGADAALAGSLDREQAEENERRRRRRGVLGTIGSIGGGIIGGLAAGPAGAAAGARIGGSLGN